MIMKEMYIDVEWTGKGELKGYDSEGELLRIGS